MSKDHPAYQGSWAVITVACTSLLVKFSLASEHLGPSISMRNIYTDVRMLPCWDVSDTRQLAIGKPSPGIPSLSLATEVIHCTGSV